MIAGQTVTFSTDERVRIVNPKSRDIFVRIFNRNDNINIVALPGGEFNVPANGETFYEIPSDVDGVKVLMSGRQEEIAFRGSTVTYQAPDAIVIRNLASQPYEFLIYKSSDTIFAVALPGGIFTLNPNKERTYDVPGDVGGSVTVRIRKPASFPDLFPAIVQTVNVPLDQTLIFNSVVI